METSELLKRVRKVELKAKGSSQNLFSGEYHSAFKGRGMSFSEVRDYRYGDDVRNIDWNVTARTGDTHIKIFEEERELTVMLLVDVSGSAYFGTASQTKRYLMTELGAVLAFSAIQNNDKVGLLLFAHEVELYIPPKKGRKHILRIIRELINHEPQSVGTDVGAAMRYLNNVVKKRCITFVLSDFMSPDYSAPLKVTARRHDLVGMRITDPREAELPNVGLLHAIDAESGERQWVDTGSKRVREAYKLSYENYEATFREQFLKSGADAVTLSTGTPYRKPLLQFFERRKGV